MTITSLRGSTLPNKSFAAGRAKTKDVVRIAPDTATTFSNGASITSGGGGGGGPTISNVSVTDSSYILSNATPYIDSTGGYIKITGTGFATGCTVYVGGNAATSTTFVSATEVRAQVGAASSNAQSVYVVNTDSSVGIKLNAITYSGTPSWSTGATLTSQIADISFSIALSATSDSSITYALASGSSTPSGTTLYSNGVFAGTVTGISSDTNYSFTVVATDVENQLSSRAFTVTISSGDASFYITPLLLNGDANVWITDSSVNNAAITIFADTKPTAFSPYNSNWSAYFDGSGDYLAFSTYNTTFGAGDFTVECWVYMPVVTNTYSSGIIGTTNYNGIDRGWALDIVGSNGYPRFYLYNSSGTGVTLNTTTVLPANQWTHLAAVRSGTTVTIYMNGVSIASGTNATSDNFSAPIYFGTIATSFALGVSSYSYAGYISNARIVVGTAVYTGNFTPQTTLLTSTQSSRTNVAAISSGTSLLTLQNNLFVDNSTNAFAVTRTGDVAIRSFGPFTETDTTTGSGYFDGTGDYLAGTCGALGAGDFTVEFWSNQPSATSRMYYFTTGTGPEWGEASGVSLLEYDGYFAMSCSNQNSITVRTNATRSQWNHIAVVRYNGVVTLYYNGVAASTTLSTTANLTGTLFRIGSGNVNSGTWLNYTGYMSDFRIVAGTAVYTTNFTPPTTNLTAIANTRILTLQYRRGENNHRFVDESGNKYPVTRGGNASQGSFSPFSPAGWSAYFDGTGDYLTVPASSDFDFGTGDYTIEGWVYSSSLTWTLYATGGGGSSDQFSCDAGTLYWNYGTFAGIASFFVTSDLNTWTHVAASRTSGNTRVFKNGGLKASTSTVASIGSSVNTLQIGRRSDGFYLTTGYMSNIRVVKGTSQYTANFTPATTALTAVENTKLLILQNNRFIDANTTPKTITTAGDVKIQAFSPFRPSGSYSPTLHGGSAYFDGTGDYLKALSTSNTLLPTNSTSTFTVDGWIYPTVGGVLAYIVGEHDPVGPSNNVSVDISAGNKISFRWWTGSENRATSADSVVPNQWNYFAVVVNANAITIYVNSTTPGQTGTTTLTTRSNATIGWGIGQYNSSNPFTGYMSGIRWSTGIARTISAIPTAPPAPDNYSTLLFNFTQGGVVDATTRNVIETLADAKISNVQSKFGTGAMYFDGTGDYLTMRNNPAHGFGTGDFTIECWMYCTDASTYRGVMGQGDNSTAGWGLYFNPNPTPLIIFIYGGAITYGAGVVTIGSWCHVAVTRYGSGSNNLRFYVNGTVVTQVTLTNNLSSTFPTYIGATAGGGYPFAGYLDDVRITAGYARYTGSTLTLPTTAFLTK